MTFSACIGIPVYNHVHALRPTVRALAGFGLPCIAVNDGSTDASAEALRELAAEFPWLTLIDRPHNGGKGAAIIDCVRLAAQRGFSHLICIDADGQHCSADLPKFIADAKEHPEALILGRPRFSEGAPLVRRLGRELSNVLVWIQTCSLKVRDVLCGFRVYPIWRVGNLMLQEVSTRRMEFDLEVVVRICWAGIPVRTIPTEVLYPADGLSHFCYLRDNLQIARTHLRLIFGMLMRCPKLLFARVAGEVR